MTGLAGIFLIAHGLVHLAIWLTPLHPDAPFDPRRSWLLGQIDVPARLLAVAAGLAFCVAGTLVLVDAESAAQTAAAASLASLALMGLTFNAWFVLAVAIDITIVLVALA